MSPTPASPAGTATPYGLAAERFFVRHHRDDWPDGQLCPSMSTGDVVVIGETAPVTDPRRWLSPRPSTASARIA